MSKRKISSLRKKSRPVDKVNEEFGELSSCSLDSEDIGPKTVVKTLDSDEKTKQVIGKYNKVFKKKLEEQKVKMEQFSFDDPKIPRKTQTKLPTSKNFQPVEGVIVKIYKVVDFYESESEDDRHVGLTQLETEKLSGLIKQDGLQNNSKKKKTKASEISRRNMLSEKKDLENRILKKTVYEYTLILAQSPLFPDETDINTNSKKQNFFVGTFKNRGGDENESNMDRIHFLLQGKKRFQCPNKDGSREHEEQDVLKTRIMDINRRRRYKVVFEFVQNIISITNQNDYGAELPRDQEQTLSAMVKSRDQKLKSYTVDLEKYNNENGNIGVVSKKDTIKLMGFFDEIPQIGEYFKFMLEKQRNIHGKRINMVCWKSFQRDEICEFNLDILKRVYIQEFGEEKSNYPITKIMNKIAKIEGLDISKQDKLTNLSEIEFSMLDSRVELCQKKWFYQLFIRSEYLQKRFVKDIAPYYPEKTLVAFSSLSPKTLWDIFVLIQVNPIQLCFFWQYPPAIQLVFISSQESAKELEISAEKYKQLMIDTARSSRVEQSHLEMIVLYQTHLRKIQQENRQDTYFTEENLSDFDREPLHSLVNSNILVKMDQEPGCEGEVHYYTGGDIENEYTICQTIRRLTSQVDNIFSGKYSFSQEDVKNFKERVGISASSSSSSGEEKSENKSLLLCNPQQESIVKSIFQNPVTVVNGDKTVGKTWLAARMELLINSKKDSDSTSRFSVPQSCLLVTQTSMSKQRIQYSFGSYYVCAYTIDSVLMQINRAMKSVEKVEFCMNSYIEQSEGEEINMSLSSKEKEQLEKSAIASYFGQKNRLRKKKEKIAKHKKRGSDFYLAVFLHLVFNKVVDIETVRNFILYCSLTQREILIIDDASLIPTGMIANLFRVLPNIKRLVIFGDENQIPPMTRGYFFQHVVKAYREKSGECYFESRVDDKMVNSNNISFNLSCILSGVPQHMLYGTEISKFMKKDFSVIARPKSPVTIVRQLLEEYCRDGQLNKLDDLQLFILSNKERDDYNRILYQWRLRKNYNRILKHENLNTDDGPPSITEKEWSCDGVFKSYKSYMEVEKKKYQEIDQYEHHEFYVGERVLFLQNHNGAQNIRFCPFVSDPVKSGLVDTIEYIMDYDDKDNAPVFKMSTSEPRMSEHIQRFLVLKKSKKMICLARYPQKWITRTFAVTLNRCQISNDNSTVIILLGEKAKEYLFANDIYVAASRARDRVVFICHFRNKDENDIVTICKKNSNFSDYNIEKGKKTEKKPQCLLYKKIKMCQ